MIRSYLSVHLVGQICTFYLISYLVILMRMYYMQHILILAMLPGLRGFKLHNLCCVLLESPCVSPKDVVTLNANVYFSFSYEMRTICIMAKYQSFESKITVTQISFVSNTVFGAFLSILQISKLFFCIDIFFQPSRFDHRYFHKITFPFLGIFTHASASPLLLPTLLSFYSSICRNPSLFKLRAHARRRFCFFFNC